MTTSLLTDHYELTMVDAALHDGTGDRHSVFEAFARSLPDGRRFGVVGGVQRLLDLIEEFRFDDDDLRWLRTRGFLHDETLDFLADYRFSGDIVGYQEGELFFPESPVLTVVAPFAEAVLLETLVLSVLNFDSAVASAAARMVSAARGRDLLEFGSRRVHERAAVAAARAAYVVGFDGTSNLEAGRTYGVPTLGTSAHAFTQVHDDELSAFRGQVEALGPSTTLLVDTYDIPDGIDRAVAAAGTGLGAVRIDSGDLVEEARRARKQLDELGAVDARIIVSSDLDEYRLDELADAPVDGYGVGTRVVTGSGAPTANFVYKLVMREDAEGRLRGSSKASPEKATAACRKAAYRLLADGVAVEEQLRTWGDDAPADARPLQVPLVSAGERCSRPSLDELRAHHRAAVAELPREALRLDAGEPALPTVQRFDPDCLVDD